MTEYNWTVIGAGPAGIATVGRLLDHGIDGKHIAWIDPEFGAGDLGGKWQFVPSNTKVEAFLDYLTASRSFRFEEAPACELHNLEPEETCRLGVVAEPLVWISKHLSQRVATFQTTATELSLADRHWTVTTEDKPVVSENVVLAVGSVPKRLSRVDLEEISVEDALDPAKLSHLSLEGATVAVFGSSHSSMIALPNLLDTPVKKVINFYRSPLKYAVYLDDWILYDDTGLKGLAADWAKANIDGTLPERLERYSVDDREFDKIIERCDHVVYTVGFEPRHLPVTPQWGPLKYDPTSGIIAPGLFGLGIAFPGYRINPLGAGDYRVGLQKFMQDLNAVLPIWLQYTT